MRLVVNYYENACSLIIMHYTALCIGEKTKKTKILVDYQITSYSSENESFWSTDSKWEMTILHHFLKLTSPEIIL